MKPILGQWLSAVRSAELITEGKQNEIATGNLHIFKLTRAEAASLTEADVAACIEQSWHEWARKLANTSSQFWFYAWFDEMSGSLNCSAAPASSSSELPFRCRFEITQQPLVIARAFLESPCLDGIPMSELVPIAWEEEDEENAQDFVLTILARLLPRSM